MNTSSCVRSYTNHINHGSPSPYTMSSQVTISTRKRTRTAATPAKAPRKRTRDTGNTAAMKSLVKMGQVFPLKARTVLRYVEDIGGGLNPGGGSYAQLFWKTNGLFDPNDALGGHQPYGFDQYAAIYNHYHVYKSVITAEFFCSPTYASGFTVGVNITPGASDADNAQTKMEKATSKSYGWICGDAPLKTIKRVWTDKAYFGRQRNEESLSAAVTADPTELSHFEIWCQNNSASAAFCGCRITIEYYVEFCEPKTLGGS